jgi:hypothetical protein
MLNPPGDDVQATGLDGPTLGAKLCRASPADEKTDAVVVVGMPRVRAPRNHLALTSFETPDGYSAKHCGEDGRRSAVEVHSPIGWLRRTHRGSAKNDVRRGKTSLLLSIGQDVMHFKPVGTMGHHTERQFSEGPLSIMSCIPARVREVAGPQPGLNSRPSPEGGPASEPPPADDPVPLFRICPNHGTEALPQLITGGSE